MIFMLALVGVGLKAEAADSESQPGQTMLWRETFGRAEISPGTPGTLDGVEEGVLLGNLPNGPTWQENGRNVSWSAAIRSKTPEEQKSGATTFDGFRRLPEELAERGMVSLWIRPSSRQSIQPGAFFQIEDTSQGKPRTLFSVKMATLPGNRLLLSMNGDAITKKADEEFVADNAIIVPLDEWALLWIAYDRAVGAELWIQTGKSNAPKLVTRMDSPGGGWLAGRVRLLASGLANQGSFAGRIGPLAACRIDSLEAAQHAPGGYFWPDNKPATWTVAPEENRHDITKRLLGGWKGLSDAIRDNVVLSRVANAWTDQDGNPAGYETLPDAAAKKKWWLDWKKGRYLPMGDRVEFEPGIYRGKPLPLSNHGGIHYTPVSGAPDYSVDVRGSVPLTGSWTQPDAAQYPRVWRYEGPPKIRRHVWGKDWQSFNVFFTTKGTAATIEALNSRPWAAHADAEGVTYISLPDGVTPDQIGPLEGSESDGFAWSGAWLGRLLIQATAAYRHTEATADQAIGAYALGVTSGPMITIIEGRGLRCAKHPAAFVGTSSEGLCIWHEADIGFDPPGRAENDPPEFGVLRGAFTPLVDYSSAPSSKENPGRIVTIYDGVTYREPTEPGDGTANAKPARRAMYFTHGTRISGIKTSHIFALTVVRNPWPTMFHEDPKIANFPTEPPLTHVAFEVLVEK